MGIARETLVARFDITSHEYRVRHGIGYMKPSPEVVHLARAPLKPADANSGEHNGIEDAR